MNDNEPEYDIRYTFKNQPPKRKGFADKIKEKLLHYKILFLIKDFPVTAFFIFVNVVMYIVSAVMSKDLINMDSGVLYKLGAMQVGAVQNGEYWRFFTNSILHGGVLHLLSNMYALFFLGQMLERLQGSKRVLIVYVTSTLVASSFSFLHGFPGVGIGASGAVFAMFGYFFVIVAEKVYKKQINTSYLLRLVFILGLNIYIGFSSTVIDNAAHIGGLVAGVSAGIFLFLADRTHYKLLKRFAPYIIGAIFIASPFFAYNNSKQVQNKEALEVYYYFDFQSSREDILSFLQSDEISGEDSKALLEKYIKLVDNVLVVSSKEVEFSNYVKLYKQGLQLKEITLSENYDKIIDQRLSEIIKRIDSVN
jgi:rhomboid protease GluP